ncbi:hypothetical protein BC833DRAFT_515721, partial [Globomyces pollinis-pini]
SWQNFSKAVSPERGSFPLDFNQKCDSKVKEYLACLKQNKNNNAVCKPLAKLYLQCRMDNGLMEKEDMKDLGF